MRNTISPGGNEGNPRNGLDEPAFKSISLGDLEWALWREYTTLMSMDLSHPLMKLHFYLESEPRALWHTPAGFCLGLLWGQVWAERREQHLAVNCSDLELVVNFEWLWIETIRILKSELCLNKESKTKLPSREAQGNRIEVLNRFCHDMQRRRRTKYCEGGT